MLAIAGSERAMNTFFIPGIGEDRRLAEGWADKGWADMRAAIEFDS
jgi:hypothetical protein